ncbi:unnamed protein product [Hapterophycus canaliculatus]
MRDTNIPDGGSIVGGTPDSAKAVGATEKDSAVSARSSSGQVSPPGMTDGVGVKVGVCEGIGDVDDADSSGPVYPPRIVRRWPSSADIGMFTDGR